MKNIVLLFLGTLLCNHDAYAEARFVEQRVNTGDEVELRVSIVTTDPKALAPTIASFKKGSLELLFSNGRRCPFEAAQKAPCVIKVPAEYGRISVSLVGDTATGVDVPVRFPYFSNYWTLRAGAPYAAATFTFDTRTLSRSTNDLELKIQKSPPAGCLCEPNGNRVAQAYYYSGNDCENKHGAFTPTGKILILFEQVNLTESERASCKTVRSFIAWKPDTRGVCQNTSFFVTNCTEYFAK